MFLTWNSKIWGEERVWKRTMILNQSCKLAPVTSGRLEVHIRMGGGSANYLLYLLSLAELGLL